MRGAFIVTFFSFFTFRLQAQDVTVRGTVGLADSTQGVAYTLQLLDRDLKKHLTAPVSGEDTTFTIQWPDGGSRCVLRLAAPGYRTLDLTLTRPKQATEIRLGRLTLHPLADQLESAIVEGRRPIVRTKGSLTTIDVKNSFLSTMGSVRDMLEYVPGLIPIGNGEVTVPGRGTPLIEIDDREITQKTLLDVLKSDNVDEIEIDRAPSVAYSGRTRAVVRIKTKRGIQDHLYLKANNITSQKRKLSETPSLDFRFKTGKLSSSATYLYSLSGNEVKETYLRYIHHPDYTFTRASDVRIPMQSQSHRFVWTADWDFSKKSRLSLMYFFNHRTHEDNTWGTITQTDKDNTTYKDLHETENAQNNVHNVSLTYDHQFNKKHKLLLIADYASTHNRNTYGTEETDPKTSYHSDVTTWSKGLFDTYTASLRYDATLPGNIKAQTGGKYAFVKSRSRRTSNNPYLDNGTYWNHTRVRNQNASAYLNLSRRWKRFAAEAGLRYEFERSRIHTTGSSDDNRVNNHDSRFTPRLRLSYDINDDWSIEANYRRYSTRVNYNQLVPSPVYKDSLSYETGNSEVSPSFTHSASLDVTWKNWTLSASYRHITDEITSAWVNLDNRTNVATYLPFNLSTMKTWELGLSYSNSFKRINVYASAYATFPYARYTYLERTRKADKVSWIGDLNLSYSLNKQWTVYTTFSYESRSEQGITFSHSRNRWDAGVRARFLKNRLTANLVVMDILHGAHYNRLMDRFMNVENGTYGTSDFRGIKLTLAYTIFNKKINVRAQQGNQEELQRTL